MSSLESYSTASIEELISKALDGDINAIDQALNRLNESDNSRIYKASSLAIWKKLKNLSEKNPNALYVIGLKNLYGGPFGKNPTKGIIQILKASELGSKPAQFDVALWYSYGMYGLDKDISKSIDMLKLLSDQGWEDAHEMLKTLTFRNT